MLNTFKLKLCYKSTLINKDNDIDPLFQLISNYSEIESLSNFFKFDNLQFLYSNRTKINKILLDFDVIITIFINKRIVNIKDYYYLSLLVYDNRIMINYKFPINVIFKLNKYLDNINEPLKKIIISKLLIDLTKYYMDLDEFNENRDYLELEEIIDKCKNILKKYLYFLDELNIKLTVEDLTKNYYFKTIDEMYKLIIISLIKNDKLSNYEYAYNIVNQMNLEAIYLNEGIINSLSEILDEKYSFIIKYKIKGVEDLFDNKKINFYFILFRYILKNSIYLYYIPFLLKGKNNILKIIKSRNFLSYFNLNNNNKKKIEYNLKFFCDCRYYDKLYFDCPLKRKDEEISREKTEIREIIENNNSNNISMNDFQLNGKLDKDNFSKNPKLNNDKSDIIMESCCITNSSNFSVENENADKKVKNKNNSLIDKSLKEKFIILSFMDIIGNHKGQADFIMELSNLNLISGGTDKKIIYYDTKYRKEEKFFKEDINSVTEIRPNQILFCLTNKVELFDIEHNFRELNRSNLQLSKGMSCFRREDLIACTYKKITILNYFFSNLKEKREYFIYGKTYKNIIQINKDLYAFTSNSINPNGEDKIMFFNSTTIKIFHLKQNYSFILSTNGLCLLRTEKMDEKESILLCACKKYKKNQKNGILLINLNEEKHSHYFYNTGDYEVHCFCQIILKEESNFLFKSQTFSRTNYFLVGGFKPQKRRGAIKLFKIIENKNFLDTKIEYIQDIEPEHDIKFKGLKSPISSIIQSKSNGNILISCWDGNIYSFKQPN